MRFLSAASVLFYAALVASSNVVDLTATNFDELVTNSGKPALVKFYAPWCGHCKKLAPTYEQLGDVFASVKDKVTIAKADGDAHKALSKRFGIKGFPTLKWIHGDKIEDYDSARTLEALTKYVTGKGINPKGAKAKKEPVSHVKVLTTDNFDSIVMDTSKGVLVEFYAPWCGYCKKLEPIYEKLATTFSRDKHIVIAKIDCDDHDSVCGKHNVQSFPTLHFFPAVKDKKSVEYTDEREEAEMTEFINAYGATYRTPGGGLTLDAGTIEPLDKLIEAALPKGFAGIAEQFTEAIKSIDHKYAPYYVKVAKKLQEKSTYITEELERLKKMVSSGGVHPEKLDDITMRQNILKRFQSTTDGEDEASTIPDKNVKDEL